MSDKTAHVEDFDSLMKEVLGHTEQSIWGLIDKKKVVWSCLVLASISLGVRTGVLLSLSRRRENVEASIVSVCERVMKATLKKARGV